ncbi:MAG: hypothetical protein E7478_03275 [Ruminococcaceae bacterium]|nr:hypothetical protein [Oscillospiraceae bacterium]
MFDKLKGLFKKGGTKKDAISADRYEGELVNGIREGRGTMYFKSGNIYKGEWHNGLMHGFGEFIYKSGEHYVGDFINGKFGGQGRFTYPNGIIYDGSFLNGKREGDGTLTEADGTRYEGNWINDKLNGMGTKYHKDGSIFRGMYSNGKAIDGFTDTKDENGSWVRVRYVRPELEAVKGCEVVLLSCPDECKIRMIKAVREITGYGLALAKDIVEELPQWVIKGATLEQAVQIRKELEANGGIAEIR